MRIFKQKLNIDWHYYQFNECRNFTIRRGINQKYSIGEEIILYKLNCYFNEETKAKVTNIQHIKFNDIKDFTDWHLHDKRFNEDSDKYDPLKVMNKIYGNGFNPDEIVTLVWFKITE